MHFQLSLGEANSKRAQLFAGFGHGRFFRFASENRVIDDLLATTFITPLRKKKPKPF